MTFAEAAEAVLADSRRAMTADEIWAEIERRGLIETEGKTPAATLYTEMMRKSANWRSDDDDRRRIWPLGRSDPGAAEGDRGALGTLVADRRVARVARRGEGARQLAGADRRTRRRQARAGAEIADRIHPYLAGTITLEALRAEFDRRTRSDWDCFGFAGAEPPILAPVLPLALAGLDDDVEIKRRPRHPLHWAENPPIATKATSCRQSARSGPAGSKAVGVGTLRSRSQVGASLDDGSSPIRFRLRAMLGGHRGELSGERQIVALVVKLDEPRRVDRFDALRLHGPTLA